jgi:hypothetical protein
VGGVFVRESLQIGTPECVDPSSARRIDERIDGSLALVQVFLEGSAGDIEPDMAQEPEAPPVLHCRLSEDAE